MSKRLLEQRSQHKCDSKLGLNTINICNNVVSDLKDYCELLREFVDYDKVYLETNNNLT